jgi:hypothetical protein
VNPLNLKSLRASSSINGNVSKKRNATRSTSMKRRSRDMKKKNTCESKSMHIGDVPSSDTVGTRFEASHTE